MMPPVARPPISTSQRAIGIGQARSMYAVGITAAHTPDPDEGHLDLLIGTQYATG